ncbi:serine hydrolase domain-containing protein [Pseudomarimonas arenosa]|uniref:Beta-lactamase family protein n=1 Tax=Pseudomarimonas arenosa TaxID=2774145 RepID=A0AAW3ZQU9_9GAMM|nr:serine hydrolase domain-containing protein [Pseudomarimonas arenosa]MBD8526957.1 beta-lactamase family protein [Pseudomarimonas arenosa]
MSEIGSRARSEAPWDTPRWLQLVAMLGLVLCMLSLLLGCQQLATDNPPPAEARRDPIQNLLDEAVAKGLPGAVVYVEGPNRRFLGASGLADRDTGTPLSPESLFHTASNGKTYVAAAALLLVDQGRLSLDRPIQQQLPESLLRRLDLAPEVSLRHLLSHTSGVYNYSDNPAYTQAVMAAPDRYWSVEELLELARGQPAKFAAGQGWSYSNTAYLLVGQLLDHQLGQPHQRFLQERILDPLHLQHTYPLPNTKAEAGLVHGYLDVDGNGDLEDARPLALTQGFADGGIVSTAEDLGRFFKALVRPSGELAPSVWREMLGNLRPSQPQRRYGLGIREFSTPHGLAYGHGGRLPGYASEVFYFPVQDVTVVVLANGTDGPLEALVEHLTEQVIAFALPAPHIASRSHSGAHEQ